MHVIHQEVLDSYKPEIIHVWTSNSVEDMEANVQKALALLQ